MIKPDHRNVDEHQNADVRCVPVDAAADQEQLVSDLPKLRNGFLIAGLFFVSEIVWATQRALNPYSREAGGYAGAATLIFSIVGTAFFLPCINVYHVVVNNVDGWKHPISPRRAVAFHFIPIFNIYWNFRWPIEIARFVNWRTQKRRMSGLLAGTIVMLGAIAIAFLDGSIGLVIIFSGLAYISRSLRDALMAPAVPWEMHVNDRSDFATNIVG